jgi:GNAT superfamily N-acetyltransferase
LDYSLRKATRADRRELERLIARASRALAGRDYRAEQIEAALGGAFGVDTQLIDDGTFFAAALECGIIGCGDWSRRRTLFGGDAYALRDAGELDPATDAARIRAFFVDPDYTRRGVGRALLERCEAEARAQGFARFELMSTLSGIPLYEALGYQRGELVRYHAGNIPIEFVPMHKGCAG